MLDTSFGMNAAASARLSLSMSYLLVLLLNSLFCFSMLQVLYSSAQSFACVCVCFFLLAKVKLIDKNTIFIMQNICQLHNAHGNNKQTHKKLHGNHF